MKTTETTGYRYGAAWPRMGRLPPLSRRPPTLHANGRRRDSSKDGDFLCLLGRCFVCGRSPVFFTGVDAWIYVCVRLCGDEMW
mmetsp:Transcript_4725/g.11122  ORF Transcript_4725/g.11122 Transcript_4725/m.11122 type:complete len:83 (-) Transcript_4725:51-299(-)